ncbi:NGFI-A-binding protein homolog isoform X2 [Anthonomus grandis grandis]|uniref:NGFI-A-binding protein homolog isoform X2 n=1 Tax=Anthonomus grandis grandis TaxID=2921223 RepID=UPI00216523C6|nr:NGFI-A-binding protein homolog isoform X2 [Anthonomus grandis grandis]
MDPNTSSNCTQASNSTSGEEDRLSNASAETSNPPPVISGNLSLNYGASAASSSARQSPKVLTPHSQVLLPLRNSVSPSVPRKIMGKNHNNTVFPTSFPSNLAELQLFRVMQNASLLLYYDTLLEMGGDDVQQLCDAGEDEFLEIMSLVGMASKPLHVRRLQKSLQEWVTNPIKFKIPLVPGEDFEIELSSPRVTSNHVFYSAADSGENSRTMYSPSPAEICALPPVVSPGLNINNKRPYSPLDPACPPSSSSSPSGNSSSVVSPSLLENQISKLAAAAEMLSKQLPNLEPKPQNAKKKVCKELELVMSMPENDPRRMDEIRRYAAIYGRFDCKRKPEKPLTLHEVSVNEAAAQICKFVPALLTRRDELFPLARQVVKDSGCYYSKTQLSAVYLNRQTNMSLGHERDQTDNRIQGRFPVEPDSHQNKRIKLEPSSDNDDQRQDYDDALAVRQSLHSLFQKNHHQGLREHQRTSLGIELEETDSQFTYSNSSSPQGHEQETVSTGSKKVDESAEQEQEGSKFSPRVIAACGDNIIAVANPALAMSSAILPLPHSSLRREEEKD